MVNNSILDVSGSLMLWSFDLSIGVAMVGCWHVRVSWRCDAKVIHDIRRSLQNDEWLLLTVICLWKIWSRLCAFARSLSRSISHLFLLRLIDYIVRRNGVRGLFYYPLILLIEFMLDIAFQNRGIWRFVCERSHFLNFFSVRRFEVAWLKSMLVLYMLNFDIDFNRISKGLLFLNHVEILLITNFKGKSWFLGFSL